jgi:two-component system chemotaxis response regulator CheB
VKAATEAQVIAARRIRVLIVDDSAMVRKILSEAISAEPDLEVAGTAPDPIVAAEKITALRPDVLTLDIEMPRMDGITFLRRLMRTSPLPVIVISSVAQSGCRAAVQAMEAGAVEVLAKPAGPFSIGDLRRSIGTRIRAAAQAKLRRLHAPVPAPAAPHAIAPPGRLRSCRHVIAIGASTGGTEAVRHVLQGMPPDCPPIVVVQHIPPVFSRSFAERLNEVCGIEVREASPGDLLRPGLALIAPGDLHMSLRTVAGHVQADVRSGPRVCYQRPSVDVLFQSVAQVAGSRSVGVLLTGMGNDGAAGLLRMRETGAHTIAQDEQTSVVYGMPKEAARMNAASSILPLPRIAHAICAAVAGSAS